MRSPLLRAAVTSLALVACGAEPPAAPPEAQPVRVLVVPDPAETLNSAYPGRAEAVQEIDLDFEVEGQVLVRDVELGDRVQEGQVLAQLDLRDFQADLDRARAVRRQTSELLVRMREASESGAISQQELDEAEARAVRARAAARIRQKALEDATLRAPFAGTVTATYVEPLQQVREGEPILRLLDDSAIEMWVKVPETLIDRTRLNPTARVRFDALPGREFAAEIVELGSEADEDTRTFPVNLRIEQPAGPDETGRILPGMAGEARAVLPEGAEGFASAGPEVPLSAVFSDTRRPSFVWVLGADGSRVERRAVETGRLTDLGIVVVEGLQPGERIVVQGGHLLSDGSRVQVLETKGGAS